MSPPHFPRPQAILRVFIDANRRFLPVAATAYAVIAFVILHLFVDQPLAQWLEKNPYPCFRSLGKAITNVGLAIYWFILFASGVLICFFAPRLKTTTPHTTTLWHARLRSWLFGLTVMTVSGLAVQILKFAFGRPRPKSLFADGETDFVPFSGNDSFPSGHSQAIWAAAAALWFIYPPLRPLYVVVAIVVSLSRVMIGVHYLSDVVVGAMLGVVLALLVAHTFRRRGIVLDLRAHRF